MEFRELQGFITQNLGARKLKPKNRGEIWISWIFFQIFSRFFNFFLNIIFGNFWHTFFWAYENLLIGSPSKKLFWVDDTQKINYLDRCYDYVFIIGDRIESFIRMKYSDLEARSRNFVHTKFR